MTDQHFIHDAAGKELDARFLVRDDPLGIVIASSGSGRTSRNRDYDDALLLILERLAAVQAELSRVEVVSNKTVSLSPEERLIALDGYPILLAAVDDLDALRRKISGGAQKTARTPGAASGGGNPQRRLRLFVEFKKWSAPSAEDLLQIIKYGHSLHHGRTIEKTERLSQMSEFTGDGSTASSRGTGPRTGQGFQGDQAMRQAVEERAMVAAEQHYAAAQWTTKRRVHDNVGYDILCTKGSEELFVEVKGTIGDGSQVIITRKEAEHAHAHSKQTQLFILYDIQPTNIDGSGTVRIISEWDPLASGSLVPISYFWRLPIESL